MNYIFMSPTDIIGQRLLQTHHDKTIAHRAWAQVLFEVRNGVGDVGAEIRAAAISAISHEMGLLE